MGISLKSWVWEGERGRADKTIAIRRENELLGNSRNATAAHHGVGGMVALTSADGEDDVVLCFAMWGGCGEMEAEDDDNGELARSLCTWSRNISGLELRRTSMSVIAADLLSIF